LNNLSHAYIFLGTEEETMVQALKLAQTANCENRELAPCGFCSTCQRIESKVHPDLVNVYPDGASIKIEQVRKLILILTEKPVEGTKKIYILHEAHTMTIQAQNALLKSLEDPIAESIVILLSNNLKQLISTVVSRCQIRDFSKLGLKPTLPVSLRQKIADILLHTTQKGEIIEFGVYVKELSDIDERSEEILEFVISLYRDALLVKTNSRAALINKDLEPVIYKLGSKLSVGTILKALDLIHEQLKAVKSRGNKNLIWYNLLMGLEEVV
jgi:DNA polymerase-3 subunit delta'